MKKESKQAFMEVAMMLPAMIILALFMITPFAMSIALSFTNQRMVQGPVKTAVVFFRNYGQIVTDPIFWRSLVNVLWFTLLVIPLQCGGALLLAILLNTQKAFKGVLRTLFFLPFITPMVIVTVIWKTIYQYPNGMMNFVLKSLFFSFQPVDWLGSPNLAMPAIVVLSAWQAYSFQMVIYLGGLQSIPNELYEAAAIDGVTKIQRFRYVTWPSLINTNILIFIITTIQALKLFTQVNVLTQGGPAGSTITPIFYLYDFGFKAQKIGYSSAASVLVFLIVLCVVLAQRHFLKSSEAQT